MYTLHIANKNYSTWSLRPWVLLKTLGIPFEEKQHLFPQNGPSYPEFKKFSPTGFVPVLDDGDVKVWDSLAIVLHVAEQHPEVWPADLMARSWARSAASEMHSGFGTLRNACGMNVGIRCKQPEISAGLKRDIDRLTELWTEGLTRFGGPFLAGAAFTTNHARARPRSRDHRRASCRSGSAGEGLTLTASPDRAVRHALPRLPTRSNHRSVDCRQSGQRSTP